MVKANQKHLGDGNGRQIPGGGQGPEIEFIIDETLACSAMGSPVSGSRVLETRLEFKVRTVNSQREARKNKVGPPSIVPCMHVCMYTHTCTYFCMIKHLLGVKHSSTCCRSQLLIRQDINPQIIYFQRVINR